MKTITISDESYEFINHFCKEINAQDSRGTRLPYLYAVRSVERIEGNSDDYDGIMWVHDGDEYSTYSMLEILLEDEIVLGDEITIDYLEYDYNYGHNDDFEGFTKYYYKEQRVIKNVFFTEAEAVRHIKQNHYHYDDPDTYVIHLFRNDETLKLIQCMFEIIGGTIES